jgi:hypothetical protein
MSAHLRKLSSQIRSIRYLAVATLREIFDEAAYERFLIRHGLSASAEAYSAFRCDHEEQKLRRPRCC